MKPRIYLAPMSGVTDLAFRLISRKRGAGLCFFEMLDSNGMLYNYSTTERLLKTIEKDSPIAAQLVGADPEMMLDAAQKLTAVTRISFLDVNSACPAKKVMSKGAGAGLLKNRTRLGKIIKRLSSRLRIPVTVKMRTGIDRKDVKECVKAAKVCEANGASTVFIHGRTMLQGYAGDVDYGSIKAVKEALKIPVFGNGNVLTPFLAKKMLDETGCDGILVARGAMGNPWIFKEIEDYLEDGKVHKSPGLAAKKKALKEHLGYIERYKDILTANRMGFMGKITTWYLKGTRDAARTRDRVFRVRSYRELLALIDGIR